MSALIAPVTVQVSVTSSPKATDLLDISTPVDTVVLESWSISVIQIHAPSLPSWTYVYPELQPKP